MVIRFPIIAGCAPGQTSWYSAGSVRKAGNLEAADDAFDRLYRFVKKHSFEGGELLREVRRDALTLFRISPSDQFSLKFPPVSSADSM